MCLEPLILAGWLMTMKPNHFHVSNENGALMEMQTCEQGAGLDLKASTSGLYGVALQYGFSTPLNGWSVTLTPKAGLAYIDHHVQEQSSRGNFQLGGQLLIGQDRWRLGVEYWHISNAWLGHKNAGLELLVLQVGWRF